MREMCKIENIYFDQTGKDCGQPPTLANGHLEREVLDTQYGASVIYICHDLGFNLYGQREVFCQSNATWGQLPVCQRK